MNRNRKQIGTHRVTMCFRSDGEVDQHRHRIPISRSLSSLWGSSLWKNLSSRASKQHVARKFQDHRWDNTLDEFEKRSNFFIR
jgi:hypothetical protein